MNDPYFIIEPKTPKVPLILSSPHSGIDFPEELKSHFVPELMERPDDTDWFVHDLYNFVSDMGITMIRARYSRWVIDLNRSPQSVPLYDDGRIITDLTPKTDFFGNLLYKNKNFEPDASEIERRKALYYYPYYRKIEEFLAERIAKFGVVLLWDAHSIRRFVPAIQDEPFPDLILGDNNQTTANEEIIEIALNGLKRGKFGVSHNFPFRGGQITRHFGNPSKNIHALQLEMAKTNYMESDELTFNEQKAEEVRKVLRPVFQDLIEKVLLLR